MAEAKNLIAAARRATINNYYEVANDLLEKVMFIIHSYDALKNLEKVVYSIKNKMIEDYNLYLYQDIKQDKMLSKEQIEKDLKSFTEFVNNYQKFCYKDKERIIILRKLIKEKKFVEEDQLLEYVEHILRHDNDERDIHMRNIKSIIILMNKLQKENLEDNINNYCDLCKEIEEDYDVQEELKYRMHKTLGYNSDLDLLRYDIYHIAIF
ncbi:MAG: hypothetical protein AB8U25_00805 [Rickettsiales endosymbiont of Dermacentor nuttalli]